MHISKLHPSMLEHICKRALEAA